MNLPPKQKQILSTGNFFDVAQPVDHQCTKFDSSSIPGHRHFLLSLYLIIWPYTEFLKINMVGRKKNSQVSVIHDILLYCWTKLMWNSIWNGKEKKIVQLIIFYIWSTTVIFQILLFLISYLKGFSRKL